MQRSLETSYRIDAADRIQAVSDAWVRFANDNQGGALLPPSILGRLLWDSIEDPATRQIYEGMLRHVRQGEGAVRFRFRCDSPTMRRLLEMEITAERDECVTFTTSVVESQSRPAVALLDPLAPRSDAVSIVCGWCNRFAAPEGAWLEAEDAIAALGIFEGALPPQLSHGICPDCSSSLYSALDDAVALEAGTLEVGALPR